MKQQRYGEVVDLSEQLRNGAIDFEAIDKKLRDETISMS